MYKAVVLPLAKQNMRNEISKRTVAGEKKSLVIETVRKGR